MTRLPSFAAASCALAAAFVAGVAAGPSVQRNLLRAEHPSNEDATAAVRAAVNFMFGSSPTYPEASVKVGDCSPSSIFPGVMCLVELTPRPSAKPEIKTVGFARLNGSWHSTSW